MNNIFLTGTGVIHKAGYTINNIKENPTVCGIINDFKFENFVSSQKSYLDRSGEFALAASTMALNEAGYKTTDKPNWDFGVITASKWGPTETLKKYTKSVLDKGARGANSILFTHLYQNSPISILAIDFRLAGHHLCYAGKDSAVNAIEAAHDAIKLKRASNILVVCYDIIPVSYGYSDEIHEGATAFILSDSPQKVTKPITDDNILILKSLKSTNLTSYDVANYFLSSL